MSAPAVATIAEDDLAAADVRELLALHVASARANSPPGLSFALDVAALREPGLTFWTARDGAGALLGCIALKELGEGEGEIKSMRTAPAHLRRGVAGALLDHVIAAARGRGIGRLWLETGSGEPYAAAWALYTARGFAPCGPYGDYVASEFNRFMTLAIDGRAPERG